MPRNYFDDFQQQQPVRPIQPISVEEVSLPSQIAVDDVSSQTPAEKIFGRKTSWAIEAPIEELNIPESKPQPQKKGKLPGDLAFESQSDVKNWKPKQGFESAKELSTWLKIRKVTETREPDRDFKDVKDYNKWLSEPQKQKKTGTQPGSVAARSTVTEKDAQAILNEINRKKARATELFRSTGTYTDENARRHSLADAERELTEANQLAEKALKVPGLSDFIEIGFGKDADSASSRKWAYAKENPKQTQRRLEGVDTGQTKFDPKEMERAGELRRNRRQVESENPFMRFSRRVLTTAAGGLKPEEEFINAPVGRGEEAVNRFMGSATKGLASIPEGLARLVDEASTVTGNDVVESDPKLRALPPEEKAKIAAKIDAQNRQASLGDRLEGITRLGERASKGLYPIDETRQPTINPLNPDFWTATMPEAGGSMVPFLAAGGAGRALGASPRLVAGAVGAAMEVPEEYHQARDAGATPDQLRRLTATQAVSGGVESLGAGSLMGTGAKTGKKVAGHILKESVQEGGQEALQSGISDVGAKYYSGHKPNLTAGQMISNAAHNAVPALFLGAGGGASQVALEKLAARNSPHLPMVEAIEQTLQTQPDHPMLKALEMAGIHAQEVKLADDRALEQLSKRLEAVTKVQSQIQQLQTQQQELLPSQQSAQAKQMMGQVPSPIEQQNAQAGVIVEQQLVQAQQQEQALVQDIQKNVSPFFKNLAKATGVQPQTETIGDAGDDVQGNLLTEIRRAGGIAAPEGAVEKGELDRLGPKESGTTGLISRKGGESPDQMRERMASEGLTRAETPQEFIREVEQETRRQGDRETESFGDYQREQMTSEQQAEADRLDSLLADQTSEFTRVYRALDNPRTIYTKKLARDFVEQADQAGMSAEWIETTLAEAQQRRGLAEKETQNVDDGLTGGRLTTSPGLAEADRPVTKPAKPGVSMSPYKIIEGANKDLVKRLYDVNLNSDEGKAGIKVLRDYARANNLGQHHVDAHISDIANWQKKYGVPGISKAKGKEESDLSKAPLSIRRFPEKIRGTAVTDNAGNPAPMYHGTSSSTAFDSPKEASWFTSDAEFGSQYAEGAHLGGTEGPARVYSAWLDLRNPYIVKDRLEQVELVNDPDRMREIEEAGYDGIMRRDEDGKVIALPFRRDQIISVYDWTPKKAQPSSPRNDVNDAKAPQPASKGFTNQQRQLLGAELSSVSDEDFDSYLEALQEVQAQAAASGEFGGLEANTPEMNAVRTKLIETRKERAKRVKAKRLKALNPSVKPAGPKLTKKEIGERMVQQDRERKEREAEIAAQANEAATSPKNDLPEPAKETQNGRWEVESAPLNASQSREDTFTKARSKAVNVETGHGQIAYVETNNDGLRTLWVAIAVREGVANSVIREFGGASLPLNAAKQVVEVLNNLALSQQERAPNAANSLLRLAQDLQTAITKAEAAGQKSVQVLSTDNSFSDERVARLRWHEIGVHGWQSSIAKGLLVGKDWLKRHPEFSKIAAALLRYSKAYKGADLDTYEREALAFILSGDGELLGYKKDDSRLTAFVKDYLSEVARLHGVDAVEKLTFYDPSFQPVVDSVIKEQRLVSIDQQANEAATSPTNDLPEPTEAQIEAGNYKKGHIKTHGLDVTIENPKGSTRSGKDRNGKEWSVKMTAHYGYIRRTIGADEEHIDVHVGDSPASDVAFVVDQIDPKTGKFDEHKVILGANTIEEAKALYDAHFDDKSGPSRRGAITTMPVSKFKEWLKTEDNTKPVTYRETAASGGDADAGRQEGETERTPKVAVSPRVLQILQLLNRGESLVGQLSKLFSVKPGTVEMKQLEEDAEFAGVLAAREIVARGNSPEQTYSDLLRLHFRMPTLGTRTSESVQDQAYSTPLPIAYVASQLAGINEKTSVYEPTAGNGALVMAANPKNVIANDLNPKRVENLRAQGFDANKADAIKVRLSKPVDVVIANPPFGTIKENGQNKQFDTEFGNITEIDHAIAFKALEEMHPKGRAVLIVGGVNRMAKTEEARSEGYNQASKRKFYANLYDNYNVVDHFTIDGQMYAKQGAAWPVDVIVIDGRGKSARKYPAAQVPPVVRSYDELGTKLEGQILDSTEREQSSVISSEGTASGPRGLFESDEQTSVGTGEKRPSKTGGRNQQTSERGDTGDVSGSGVVRGSAIEDADTPTGRKSSRKEGRPAKTKAEPDLFSSDLQQDQPDTVGGRTDAGDGRTSELEDIFAEERENIAQELQPKTNDLESIFAEERENIARDLGQGKESKPSVKEPRVKSPASTKPKTETQSAKQGLKQKADAFMDLFGDKPVKPGPAASLASPKFDEATYAKAKPLFESIVGEFQGLDDRGAIRALLQYLKQEYGDAALAAIDRSKPYILRFVEDRAKGIGEPKQREAIYNSQSRTVYEWPGISIIGERNGSTFTVEDFRVFNPKGGLGTKAIEWLNSRYKTVSARDVLPESEPFWRKMKDRNLIDDYDLELKESAKVEQKPVKPKESDTHSPYEPLSKSKSFNVMTPRNMAGAVKTALANFEERHGSPDEYVAEKLGYKPDEVSKYFSAEQVDAIALAVDNIERGKGFVIGDQCVAAGTKIYDPLTNTHTPIEILAERNLPIVVLALTKTGLLPVFASAPFKKGEADLFKVVLDDGRKITVTAHHRFLTPDGWSSIGAGLHAGHFLASAEGRPACNLEFSPLTHVEDAQRLTKKPQDCLDGYCRAGHQYDGQLQSEEGIGQAFLPSQADVPEHNLPLLQMDDPAVSEECNHQHQSFDHHSRNSFSPLGSRDLSSISVQAFAYGELLLEQTRQSAQQFPELKVWLHQLSVSTLPSPQKQTGIDLQQQVFDSVQASSSLGDYTGWRRIESIEFIGRNDFYDLWVPGHENYVAEGLIHHNTGIGKGRINAAVIRYAIKNGKTPVFVTQKPALYADMIRDLKNIGLSEFRPLITNSGETIPLNAAATEWMHEAADAKAKGQKVPGMPKEAQVFRAPTDHIGVLEQVGMSGKLKGYDAVFTTYDQMNPSEGLFNKERHRAVSSAIRGGVLIMDESHTAGGEAVGGRGSKPKPSRAKFFRELVKAAGSVFYSSATYAKRSDIMDLYSKTDLGQLGTTGNALVELFQRGGVALQQVVASKLAEAGQYMRRERTFDGIKYDPEIVEVDKSQAENISTAMRLIVAFDKAKARAVAELKKEAKETASLVSEDGSIGQAGVDSSNFTSLMHNVVDQMLLGLAADQAAAKAIEAIERGEKPVLTVSNTMESFLQDAGLSPGDAVDLTFKDVLMRYVRRSRDVVIKDRNGKRIRRLLTDDELGFRGVEAYEAVEDFVNEAEFAEIPISPIDRVRRLIEKAGYKVDEITGRTTKVDLSGPVPILRARSAQDTKVAGRRRVIGDFNNGRLDAMILNQAGSTGISLHASKDEGKDIRPRLMIIWQAEKNIDTHMQMLGRINRTGQEVLPRYIQMIADVPASKRPAAVLLKKMASLSANTTASRKSAVQTEGVSDFMNELGDVVIARILTNDAELSEKLDNPLAWDGDELSKEGAARKVSGRIPLLTLAEQADLYDRIENEYADFLAQKEAMGENPLEAKTEDFKAETLSKEVLTEGIPGSPFSEPAYIEKVKIRRTVKPYTSAEVSKMVRENLGLSESASEADVRQAAGAKVSRFINENREAYDVYKKSLTPTDVAQADAKTQAAVSGQIQKAITTANHWGAVARAAQPGAMITVNTDSGAVSGVVLDMYKRGKPKNPYSLSSWVIRLAVLDGRELRIGFNDLISKEGALKAGQSPDVSRLNPETGMFEYRPMLPEFDASQGTKKQTRYMVTGNIVSGFAKLPKGQILNYTDADGNVKQGVLLPTNFDAAQVMAEMPVDLVTAAQVATFLDEVHRGRVQDAKQELTLQLDPRGFGVNITVPSSKALGGKYFLDKDLIKLTGQFVKGSGLMKATFDRSDLPAVFDHLKEKGVTLQVSGKQKDQAKAILEKQRSMGPAAALGRTTVYGRTKDGVDVVLADNLSRAEANVMVAKLEEETRQKLFVEKRLPDHSYTQFFTGPTPGRKRIADARVIGQQSSEPGRLAKKGPAASLGDNKSTMLARTMVEIANPPSSRHSVITSTARVREALKDQFSDKAQFDAFILSEAEKGSVTLFAHDHPSSLTTEEKAAYVTDGKQIYNAISLSDEVRDQYATYPAASLRQPKVRDLANLMDTLLYQQTIIKDRGSRGARMFINDHARVIFGAALTELYQSDYSQLTGLNLSRAEVNALASYLEKEIPGATPEYQVGLKALSGALRELLKNKTQKSFSVVDVTPFEERHQAEIPSDRRDAVEGFKADIREEGFHWSQIEVDGQSVALVGASWAQSSKGYGKYRKALVQKGYRDDPETIAAEAAAKIAAGKYDDLGIRTEADHQQAAEWLASYFEKVAEKHGIDALNKFDRLLQPAKEAKLNAKERLAERIRQEREAKEAGTNGPRAPGESGKRVRRPDEKGQEDSKEQVQRADIDAPFEGSEKISGPQQVLPGGLNRENVRDPGEAAPSPEADIAGGGKPPRGPQRLFDGREGPEPNEPGEFARDPEQESLFGKDGKPKRGWKFYWDNASDIINVSKALRATFDLSATLRQGFYMSVPHPVKGGKSFVRQLKSLKKSEFEKFVKWLKRHPAYRDAKATGLEFSGDDPLNIDEENFGTRLAGKIPGIRMAERAFATLLDSMRIEIFDIYRRSALKNFKDPRERFESMQAAAEWINKTSGRAHFGNGKYGTFMKDKAIPFLNVFGWSPRYVYSRFQIINPMTYAKNLKTPARRAVFVRQMSEMFTVAAALMATGALAKAAGATISFDDDDADFLKLRFGTTRYDVLAGVQQVARLAIQIGKWIKSRGAEEDEKKLNKLSTETTKEALRFARTKLAPVPGFFVDWLNNWKKVTGETHKPGEFWGKAKEGEYALSAAELVQDPVFSLALPLMWSNTVEAYIKGYKGGTLLDDEADHLKGLIKTGQIVPFEFLGLGVQDYDRPEYSKPTRQKLAEFDLDPGFPDRKPDEDERVYQRRVKDHISNQERAINRFSDDPNMAGQPKERLKALLKQEISKDGIERLSRIPDEDVQDDRMVRAWIQVGLERLKGNAQFQQLSEYEQEKAISSYYGRMNRFRAQVESSKRDYQPPDVVDNEVLEDQIFKSLNRNN